MDYRGHRRKRPADRAPAEAAPGDVFEKNGAGAWIQKAKLTDPNGGNSDYFGTQVAISGGAYFYSIEEICPTVP